MAAEAAQRSGYRRKSAVAPIGRGVVTGRQSERLRRGIVTQPMFGDCILAGLADPGNRLRSGAECPLRQAAGAPKRSENWIGGLWRPERARVLALGLRLEFRGVALPAGRLADVGGCGILRDQVDE